MSNRNYEAMFILDNNAASADFEGTSAQVDEILQKHGATIVQKEKWDERKLAYEIKGHRRGTYYLTYFSADPDMIRKIDEDVHLNEMILRHMVLTLERPIDEHIATQAAERELLAEDSRKNSLGGWGGRRGDRDRDRRGPPPRRDAAPADDAPAGAPAKADAPAAKAEAPAAKAEAPAPEAAPAKADAAPEAKQDETKTAATEAGAES